MKFCHIAPVAHLDLVKDRSAHLTLAHLIDEGHQDYIDFYKNQKFDINIMDNSAFELYKAQLPMFCLLYTSPSPRDLSTSRMPSSA